MHFNDVEARAAGTERSATECVNRLRDVVVRHHLRHWVVVGERRDR